MYYPPPPEAFRTRIFEGYKTKTLFIIACGNASIIFLTSAAVIYKPPPEKNIITAEKIVIVCG